MADTVTIKLDGDSVLVPAQVCAAVFGVTTRTLSKWTAKGCPKTEFNTYDLKAVIAWKYSNDSTPESLVSKQQKADIRFREARASIEETKHKALIGEYVAVEDVKNEVTEMLTQVRIGLLSIKQKTVQSLYATYPEYAHEVANLVEREIERGLKALAKGQSYKTKQSKAE